MGSAASKPEARTYTPSTPIDFSASFLSQLENSTESDYSRAQYTEKYIQDRVANELKKLESEALAKLQSTAQDALIKDDQPGLSVSSANEKVEKLTKILQENAEKAKVVVPENVAKAKKDVIECLKNNESKSLNCWEEVENFKKLVRNV
ncbi:Piso0_000854 [Millerozyma farinosa CBS 7064]|uniref:Piso0_000854 protein n=1 Tax=Pichia sorbitophila (strain ATCC MYA-4447 / BCRC 22081 / CBS 7064 / NBRC 10061 / NRRL Y-12695) TaxID=559304 RepID=G8YRP9_PICSO|nr:Piso0_000854 [Millerozyma farinosa CBS 7064]